MDLTAECPGLVSWWNLFSKAKINKTNVAIVVYHQVFWFQITIAVMTFVEVVKGLDNTGDVETGNRVIEWAFSVKCSPQITTQIGISQQENKFAV